MKKGKAFYNLIFVVIAVLSLGLICFSTTPGIIVKADSETSTYPINETNSMLGSFSIGSYGSLESNQYGNGIQECLLDTYIFKLSEATTLGQNINLNAYVKFDTNPTSAPRLALLHTPNALMSSPYNESFYDTSVIGYYGAPGISQKVASDNIGKTVNYIQLSVPYYADEANYEAIKVTDIFIRWGTTTATPIARIKAFKPSDSYIYSSYEDAVCVNDTLNLPTYNSLYNYLNEGEFQYNISFLGYKYNDSSLLLPLATYTFVVNADGIIVSDLDIAEIYASAETQVKSYFENNVYYDFIGWDLPYNQITNLKQNLTIIAQYHARTTTTHTIKFYGAKNELLFTGTYFEHSNGEFGYESGLTLQGIYEIAENAAKQLDDSTGFNESTNEWDFYYNRYFVGWDIPYTEELKLTSNVEVYGMWEMPNEYFNINIFDKDNNLIETLNVKSGTLFSELMLETPESLYLYEFNGWYRFNTEGFEDKIPMLNHTMVVKDLNIKPVFDYVGIEVQIVTNNVSYPYGGEYSHIVTDKLYHQFDYRTLSVRTYAPGETLVLPIAPYIQSFVPKFWVEYQHYSVPAISPTDYLNYYNNRLGDYGTLESIKLTDPELKGRTLKIFLLYDFEKNALITTTPTISPGDLISPEDNNKPTTNPEQPQQTLENDSKALTISLVAGLAVLVTTITTLSIITYVRRKHGKTKENKTN